jgi:hypothetical protein
LGVWLRNQRQGKKHLDRGTNKLKLLKGMTAERAAALNERLPGWDLRQRRRETRGKKGE